jgi:hypothetical protein
MILVAAAEAKQIDPVACMLDDNIFWLHIYIVASSRPHCLGTPASESALERMPKMDLESRFGSGGWTSLVFVQHSVPTDLLAS